jgi:hypothetical protein
LIFKFLTVRKNGQSRAEVINMNKINRNALCPCGSGRKYKQCCGRNKRPVLKDLTPGLRMKGGIRSNPTASGFIVIVHTWDNIACQGEPEEWRAPNVFPTEDTALQYYKAYIRPSLQRLMAEIQKEQNGTHFIQRELE